MTNSRKTIQTARKSVPKKGLPPAKGIARTGKRPPGRPKKGIASDSTRAAFVMLIPGPLDPPDSLDPPARKVPAGTRALRAKMDLMDSPESRATRATRRRRLWSSTTRATTSQSHRVCLVISSLTAHATRKNSSMLRERRFQPTFLRSRSLLKQIEIRKTSTC